MPGFGTHLESGLRGRLVLHEREPIGSEEDLCRVDRVEMLVTLGQLDPALAQTLCPDADPIDVPMDLGDTLGSDEPELAVADRRDSTDQRAGSRFRDSVIGVGVMARNMLGPQRTGTSK
jgi:hypothetical protein